MTNPAKIVSVTVTVNATPQQIFDLLEIGRAHV